ncbi:hypothetical protein H6P81_021141 [Aristolochia fimbriata]|uniref:DUF3741 domain-containing protein n=1 Tax=Aristolochia fimbriata TaxID=158543 RepID=A0AAV7DXQ3_ARIFI|nr:hypothetical protein H6P81_021141 [Aristolochia fimbriata]
MDQVSNEIVLSQGGSQGSKHTIDMHVALAFALENYGKLGTLEVHGNHSDRKLLDIRPMTHNNFILSDKSHLVLPGGLPALSHLQINEISRGAQKLHQILKVCSKGLNYDRYSIDMGRELLKGAMDLEESLRMLVNLQEASECSVHSQQKKIQLLEEDEEDDTQDQVKAKRLLDKPRFSFDRPSTKPLGSGAHEQKLLGSSAPQASPLNQQKKPSIFGSNTSNFLSHRRTRSCDWNSQPDHTIIGTTKDFSSEKFPTSPGLPTSASGNKFSEQKPLGPKMGKRRIPNVIAKLMGLEELPPCHEPKTNGAHKVAKEGAELIQKSKKRLQLTSTKGTNSMRAHSESLDPLQIRVLQTNKRRGSQDSPTGTAIGEEKWQSHGQENTEHMIPLTKAEKEMCLLHQLEPVPKTNKLEATPCAPISKVSGERKLNTNEQKETEKKVPLSNEDSYKVSNMVSTQLYFCQTKELSLTKRDGEINQLNQRLTEKQSTGKGDHKAQDAVVSTFELNPKGQAFSRSNSRQALDGQEPRRNRIQFQKELKVSKHQNTMHTKYEGTYNSQYSEPSVQQKLHLHNDKHMAMGDRPEKIKQRVREGRKSEILKNTLKHVQKMNPEKRSPYPNRRSSKENIIVPQNKEGRNSPSVLYHTEQLSNGSLEEQKYDYSNERENLVGIISPTTNPTSPTFIMYHEGTPPERIQDNRVTSKIVDPGKINESCAKQAGNHATCYETREGTSLVQKLMQRKQESTQAKEAAPGIQMAKGMEEQVQKQSLLSSCSSNSTIANGRAPRERVITTDIKDKDSEVVAVQQLSVPLVGDQTVPASSHKDIQSEATLTGATLSGQNINGGFIRPQRQNQTFSKSFKQGTFTEQESNLKQMLITSQHFLTAAVAFFKLHIPISILHASCHRDEKRESKLVLDCAYEIMKRKGRRKELVFHPSVTMPIVSMKIKSLDDLVKELNRDLAHLQGHREPQGDDYDAARYLHKILDREIKDTNPDANCMWEFGWNCRMFAYIEKEEVIRDVEKHLFNRLIDEIIGDHFQISTTKT